MTVSLLRSDTSVSSARPDNELDTGFSINRSHPALAQASAAGTWAELGLQMTAI